jgi:glycosyltransferase involved in cell wall biosynthesis
MQVGVNLIYLRPNQVGGSEIYIRELIRHMAKINGLKLTLFCSEEVASLFNQIESTEYVILSSKKYNPYRRFYYENIGLIKHLNSIDLLFSPANFVPFLLPSKIPQVVTVHDLQHIWLKEYFSPITRVGRSFFFKISFSRCKKIIAISEYTKQDIIRKYDLSPDLITTVHNGVDKTFSVYEREISKIKCKYKIQKDYFIYPATLFPHKNHLFLVDVFSRFLKHSKKDMILILTGGFINKEYLFWKYVKASGLSKKVIHLGYISHKDVLNLMAGAKALLFPSKYEGFGLPVIEAMLCGLPVIASNVTSIPEVADKAAILIDPDNMDEWLLQMEEIVTNDSLRETLIKEGYKNIERFSWETCAEGTYQVFKEVLEMELS